MKCNSWYQPTDHRAMIKSKIRNMKIKRLLPVAMHVPSFSWGCPLPAARCLLPAALCAMRYALCGFLFFFLAPALEAQTELTTADLVARVQDHYDRNQSFTADFVQKTRSRTASLGTSARGKLYFLKPKAIRWDYEEPLQKFVVNEEKAWLYVPDEETIYLYQLKQIISSPIVLSFFSGLGHLSEMFSISQLPADAGPPVRYRLELLPLESESAVSRVSLQVWHKPRAVVGDRDHHKSRCGLNAKPQLSGPRIFVTSSLRSAQSFCAAIPVSK